MSFLTNMFSAAKAAESAKPTKKADAKQSNGDQVKGGNTRSAVAQARYAEAFAEPTTVPKAAGGLNITHVGCLNQVYRYEKRGFIKRVGTEPSFGRPILWQWVKK